LGSWLQLLFLGIWQRNVIFLPLCLKTTVGSPTWRPQLTTSKNTKKIASLIAIEIYLMKKKIYLRKNGLRHVSACTGREEQRSYVGRGRRVAGSTNIQIINFNKSIKHVASKKRVTFIETLCCLM
jgi:hypothetical protein